MAAALKSKAKHVGFVGGVPATVIRPFEAGYKAGVKSVDPKIKIDVTYLTQDPTDAKTAFENPSGGKAAATAMYEKRRRRGLPRSRQVRSRCLPGGRGRG